MGERFRLLPGMAAILFQFGEWCFVNVCTLLLKGIIVFAAHANWECREYLIHVHTVVGYFIDTHIYS